ncbi:MAG TPA: Ig-like domain-containing protein [Ramlibacter sp.]|jgi:hypothetical protein|nr:Ig-like domain-containing protein [Ramlibacter sp.]
MNFSLRSSAAAAALLLAPLGAALVAQPAAAQHVYVAAPAHVAHAFIERVTVNVVSHERGHDLHFRLVGSHGARAFVRVPGLFDAMALEEKRPGVYEAIRTVSRHEDPRVAARAVGLLENGNQRVTAQAVFEGGRDADRAQRRDRVAPEISDLTPGQGERVSERGRTRITARVTDEGSGVESVSLRVDGRDVSRRVRLEGDDVRYADDLLPGRHTAELQVRDRAGNVTRRSWSFDVIDHDRGRRGEHGGGYGR